MSVMVEFSMTPLDKGESVSPYVARSIDIISRSGVAFQLTPMGTILEGEWDEVMAVVRDCFERMREDCRRVSVSLKVDYRADRTGGLEGKIRSIEERLGRSLRPQND
jgi:uncharacterized protein (TIGR00106 family)